MLRVKAVIAAAPRPQEIQNSALGRSPARSTAQAAVAAGSNPITTAACEVDAPAWSARPLKTGKPNTTPATMTR